MTVREIADRHYVQQQAATRTAVRQASAIWKSYVPSDLDGSHRRNADRLLVAVSTMQAVAAQRADGYVDGILTEQNLEPDPAGEVRARSLAGVASDGRPLDTLLYEPVIATKAAVGQGATTERAMARGQSSLVMLVATQVQDAGRLAESVAMTARPQIGGYRRQLNPPSCARCVILAGSWYRWNAGFQRHPMCFPAGVAVSGPQPSASTRRRYEGELAIITTASGQELPATGNHPVLTDRGWVPANLIEEGEYVVRSVLPKGARPLVVPDVQQVPTRIEDVRVPGRVSLLKVPSATEDFHGDGGHGEVDVVLADRFLRGRLDAADTEQFEEVLFPIGVGAASGLAGGRTVAQELPGTLGSTGSVVRGRSLSPSLFGGHLTGTHLAGLRHVADRYAGLFEAGPDGRAADPVAAAEAVLALSGLVRRRDVGDGERHVAARWDAPALPFSHENRAGYAGRGRDLLDRIAGQVELDRVVEVRRVEWSGHVYNLTSSEGWFAANGLIVSNCDCRHVPSVGPRSDYAGIEGFDPQTYFDSLDEAAQDRYFTKGGAQAIRDGADMNQVVNARRGMRTTAAYGRKVSTTLEGTTVRGSFGRQVLREGGGARRVRGERYRRIGTLRLSPEQIYQDAKDRDDAIRLLKRFGYLT